MQRSLARMTAAAILGLVVVADPVMAQPRPSIREAAARVSFAQSPPPARRDSNANGTAIGALVGAAGMGTFLAILWNQCRTGCENDLDPWAPYAAIGVGAAGGAAVGYLIDRARVRASQKVGVMPSVTRRQRGVTVALRF